MEIVKGGIKEKLIDDAWVKASIKVTFTPWCEAHNINRRISFFLSNVRRVIKEGLELCK